MRYLINYDLVAPGKNYDELYRVLAMLNAKRVLLSQWVTNRTNTSPTGIRDYLRPYVDSNDRLLVSELDGAGWASYNLLVDPKTV